MDHRSLRKSYPLKSLEQSIWHWGILAISALLSGLIADSSFAQDHVENITFNKGAIDRMWVLTSAALVFLMQAGFKCFEVGIVRTKNATATGMKNIIDWLCACIAFFCLGFGFMFGTSANGIVGTDLFALVDLEKTGSLQSIFFLFQLAFAGTALTIVSGAMSERTGFVFYLCGSVVIGLIIYPIFGHWVWGNLLLTDNKPWLAELGFIDFAGSTVVHSLGAWVALVGVWFVGPRLGRYGADGKLRQFESHSYAYSILGVILLWFGWWGFNGGSQLALDDAVGPIIVNTNLAAAAAGLSAFFHCYFFQNREGLNDKLLGGILGGLVAITAGCSLVSYSSAIVIGLIAGVVHNYSYVLLLKTLKIDDPVGAIPVHGFCGAFGTFAVALFGKQELLPHPRFTQMGVQLVGIVVCFVWAVTTAYIMYKILKHTVGLRVSPSEEQAGINLAGGEAEEHSSDDKSPSEEDIRKIMGL